MSDELRGRRRPIASCRKSETKAWAAASPSSTCPNSTAGGVLLPYQLPLESDSPPIQGPLRAFEPTHKPSTKDTTTSINVFSHTIDDWIEVPATFVDDLTLAWISKKLFSDLGLDAHPPGPDLPEWGFLGKKCVSLGGTTDLRWFPKKVKKSRNTTCRVVDSSLFGIYLPAPLLPSSSVTVAVSSSAEVPSREETGGGLPGFSSLKNLDGLDQGQEEVLNIDTATTQEEPEQFQAISPQGSFDGLRETISETSDEATRADGWMALLKTGFHDRFAKSSDVVRDPVKIAVVVECRGDKSSVVLDTGLDTAEGFIKGAVKLKRVKAVKSFVPGDSSTSDEFGHGTHVASLLLKVAPYAQVFVLKVAKREEILAAESISDAINYAANDLRVDIITMSFGFDKENASVQAAILNAFSKNILMFAAASNSGGNRDVKYPARKDEVICVYATDGSGNPFKGNPTTMISSSFHFATLGEGVKSTWPRKLQDPPPGPDEPSERRQTGTSFATPIVAAIAACIIEFAVVQNLSEDLLRVLKTRQGMQKTILRLMVDERSGLHYVHPWKMFSYDRTDNMIIDMMTDILRS